MRKLLVIICGLMVIGGAMGNGNVYAATVPITLPDGVVGNSGVPVTWGLNPLENQEVEPGCQTGQVWDLEAFAIKNNNTLVMVAGYNFISQGGYAGGSVFLDTNNAVVSGNGAIGTGPPPATQLASLFGYEYAITITNLNATLGTGSYSAINLAGDPNATVNTVALGSNSFSNALSYASGGSVVQSGQLTYVDHQTDAQIAAMYGAALGAAVADGTNYHFALEIPLTWLPFNTTGFFHYTYECGNDFMIGKTSGLNVPIPPSVLLLGSGLLGLVGLRRYRKK